MSVSLNLSQLQAKVENDQINLNQFFLLIMGAFVLFMQSGFAFLEAGSVRAKNVVNILVKNVLDCFIGSIVYWAVGYAFAYGDVDASHPQFAANKFIGFKYFFGINADGPDYFATWFFQFVFAATAATIVSGAVAERTEFGAYLIYSTIITGFIYPVVTHWAWSTTGWLKTQSIISNHRHSYGADGRLVYDLSFPVTFVDFAGSAVVHVTGGVAALMGAIIIGPRIGRFNDPRNNPHPGHSTPLTALGAFILFLGFLAFNGGSELAIVGGDHGVVVAEAFMNTIIGGATGSIFAVAMSYFAALYYRETHCWCLILMINGGLAGMVAMCAGCNAISQGAAFGLGAMGGITVYWISAVMKWLHVDDPLDAFAVHFGGGVVGILATPVFMRGGVIDWTHCDEQLAAYIVDHPSPIVPGDDGFFLCDHFEYKVWAWNLLGFVIISLWTIILSGLVFYVLKIMGWLRVSEENEKKGLDIGKHGGPAYPVSVQEPFAYGSK